MDQPAGIILAGGLARRMGGGDKPMRLLAGRPILDHVIAGLRPQVLALALSANGDPARFGAWGLPVVGDSVPGNAGPLAGILAGMDWAAHGCPVAPDILTVSGDTPFLPSDLADRLRLVRRQQAAEIAVAASGGRLHPVIGLWPVRLASSLRNALSVDGPRKVELFLTRFRVAVAAWPADTIDPFFNINTEADLVRAEAVASSE
jgi:molybdopterin-guanine dinucleotide biosynthesis protein A